MMNLSCLQQEIKPAMAHLLPNETMGQSSFLVNIVLVDMLQMLIIQYYNS